MKDRGHLHRAINQWLRYEGWMRRRGKHTEPPYGEVRTTDQWASRQRPIVQVTVRCEDVAGSYLMASTCRRQRPNWHNRVHHARARWIATDPTGGLLELGQTWCGRTLSDPLYADLPQRDCGCDGPALLCPLCELAFHPSGLAGVCEALR